MVPIREATRLTLEGHGYRVRAAADGITGLALFREQRPDVAVLDIMLPGLNWVSLAGRIREESGVSAQTVRLCPPEADRPGVSTARRPDHRWPPETSCGCYTAAACRHTAGRPFMSATLEP